ncbi:MAG: hypothetical protein F6K35_33840 [Okeania sp. SIO2H7]|nr:hypothetical protein [Okeania sp. SIO2H7]
MPSPGWLDPTLLRAARNLYLAYLEVHAEEMKRPSGVAISPDRYRGQLIFARKPILLPGECFIPFEQIESELY